MNVDTMVALGLVEGGLSIVVILYGIVVYHTDYFNTVRELCEHE
jgi:hypothetical protein